VTLAAKKKEPGAPRGRRSRAGAGAVVLVAVLLAFSSLGVTALFAADGDAAPPYPGSVSQWRARREANAAFSHGQLKEAARIYGGLLASMSPTDGNRALALYRMALIHLSAKPPLADPSVAGTELRELVKSFPQDENRIAADALLGTLARGAAQHAKVEALSKEQRALESEIAEIKKKNAKERESRAEGAKHNERQLRAEIATLRKRVSSLEAQLKDEQAALIKARAALRKVSETLVGGKKSGN